MLSGWEGRYFEHTQKSRVWAHSTEAAHSRHSLSLWGRENFIQLKKIKWICLWFNGFPTFPPSPNFPSIIMAPRPLTVNLPKRCFHKTLSSAGKVDPRQQDEDGMEMGRQERKKKRHWSSNVKINNEIKLREWKHPQKSVWVSVWVRMGWKKLLRMAKLIDFHAHRTGSLGEHAPRFFAPRTLSLNVSTREKFHFFYDFTSFPL